MSMKEENELSKLENPQQLIQVTSFVFLFENVIRSRVRMVCPYQSKCHLL